MLLRARILPLVALAALAGLSSGCLVLTLQPVYDDASLQLDETLPGTWQAQEQGMTVVIERGEWKSYKVTYTARNASYSLTAYLTRLGDELFIDVTPDHGVEGIPLMIPAHGIGRLQHAGDTMTIAALDYDWFTADARTKKGLGLDAALDARQNLLVTSKTETLRAWLLGHRKTAEVFREPVTFTRAK